ncbi:hypothetical protein SAMN06265360_105246 [Haloechinothrix alba]|uniref:Uncharacterized protein n=1 Tax=Haloechinothrix alba TaxID=664784 RepID=A0A238W9G0_9PSEU|nr:pyridoxamine 5'-phosphate oxidase [Haloechinothrix alba]SNR43047.1 hypothetical protein SAMN06265360_105246 [Haloechinothrix alba]
MAEADARSRRVVTLVSALAGLAMLAAGVWSLAGTRSFAAFANFGHHEHFLHDLGAFQIGIGVMVLLALIWADALATALAALFVANTLHVVNHVIDLSHGGFAWQAWALAAVSVAVAVALVLRVRQLGSVLGAVSVSTEPTLERFLRQKTVNVTTYRADGTPRAAPQDR